jgi:hypothetical protein
LNVHLSVITEPANLDIEVINGCEEWVASGSVIETRLDELDLTLHLSDPESGGEYVVSLNLAPGRGAPIHHAETRFRMMPPEREG